MKKSFLVISLVVMLPTLFISFTKPKERLYKNLKVLSKDTNKQEMDSIMKHFAGSLGVRCNFCHVRLENEKKDWDFASDANEHKLLARDMMRMTLRINKKYFKEEKEKTDNMQVANAITCYSCHNGKKEPGKFPPPQPRSGQQQPPHAQQ